MIGLTKVIKTPSNGLYSAPSLTELSLVLQKIVTDIQKIFPLKKILLFGSYAMKGYNYSPNVNLMFISKNKDLNYDAIIKYLNEFSDQYIWTIFLCSEKELKQKIMEQDVNYMKMLENSKELFPKYEINIKLNNS